MSNVIRFIGDIHGKYQRYLSLLNNVEQSIQVGDFGFGFGSEGKASYIDSMLETKPGNHRMIRGNHDSPDEARRSKNFIPDATIEIYDGVKIMYIGGAASIDYKWRTEGVNFWSNEELSWSDLYKVIDLYKEEKPDILITHECPEFFAQAVTIPRVRGIESFQSRTRSALDIMFEHHKPKVLIFGHWHIDIDLEYEDTRYICLNELSYIDLDLNDLKSGETIPYNGWELRW